MRRLMTAAKDRLRRVCTSNYSLVFLVGAAAGAMLLAWCFQWTAWFGTSLPAVTALVLSILLGLELGWRSWEADSSEKTSKWFTPGGLGFLLCWTLAFSWFLNLQGDLLGLFAGEPLMSPAISLGILFGLALTIFTPAVFVLARLPFAILGKARVQGHAVSPLSFASLYLLGISTGLLVSTFWFVPWFGLSTTAVAFALTALVATAARFSFASSGASTPRVDEQASHLESVPTGFWDKQGREIWTALVMICLGGVFAWVSRAVDQLLPSAVTLPAAKWSCLVFGWATGLAWGARRSAKTDPQSQGLVTSLFLGAWLVLIAALFPWLVSLTLSLTVSISQVFLISVCRFALVFAMVAPLGLAWGIFSAAAFGAESASSKQNSTQEFAPAVPLLVAAFLAGWLVCQWALIPNGSMPALAVGFAFAVLFLAMARFALERSMPSGWVRRSQAAGFVLMILSSFIWVGQYQPQTSARLLFSGPVFAALQGGLDRELLTAIDEGRHLATLEGRQGTYTLWKYRGVQFQLRQNGLPKGMASGDTRLCPDFTAEVLPAAVPLILHERPETMLIMGLGSGVPVTTALAFPTQEVTCVESDPGLIQLIKDKVWQEKRDNPAEDDRFSMLPVDPALWLKAKSGTFDIVLSNPHQPTLAQSAAYFTQSFYEEAAAKLTEDGLFCQRFSFIDFGPEALRVTAQTMHSVFRDVVFLEMAGGEMLLIGTNSPKGVAREGYLDRLQKDHVRRQLAQLGWDWSIPLNLTAFNHEALEKFSAENQTWKPGPNTSANGTLAFRLPDEMNRWGMKPLENQQALAKYVGRFAEWGGIDTSDPDLLRRLAEVTGQRKLMVSRPDEYWAYRKVVKDQVTKRPRSIIVQVKGEAPRQDIHPDEKRRMAYFRYLSDAFKHHPHRAEDIASIERFAEPYDPLVSYFLHGEVAALYARAENRNYAAELKHRIHAAHFAAPGDRSVRSLTEAIGILSSHAEATASPTERWDHLDALVQLLKQRWAVRAGVAPKSTQVTLNDVDESLSAVKRAINAMDEFYESAGVGEEHWQARKRFIQTTVIHPLRAYRAQLMPFHERERQLKQKLRGKKDSESELEEPAEIPVGI